MTNNQTEKKVFYSETFEQDDTGTENKTLQYSVTKLEEENRTLSQTLNRLEEEGNVLRAMFSKVNDELTNLKKPSLLVADVVSVIDEKKAVIRLPNGNKFYCHTSNDAKDLHSGDSVLVDQKSLNILKKIDVGDNLDVEKFVIIEKPGESWKEIGGLNSEIQEVKEVIELPLKKPHLFEKIGIKPPKGILLHGPPGTGKTLLAKAVAHSTNATFIEIVGSELVQKFIGEGAKLVKDIFILARQKAPSIVFIDEIDALAAIRMENGTSGEREVNRTFMQLLAELDGFKHLGDVKIIGATNRIDILDRAIIRPGRLDRLIEVGLPDKEGRRGIMKIHTRDMNMKKVRIKDLVQEMEGFSGAEIQAVCTEAGYFAIRENRNYVTNEDFVCAIDKIQSDEGEEGSGLFG